MVFFCSDLELEIDRMRTTQILFNLISNAIKFSADAGVITIECEYKRIEWYTFQVEISVIDHGIGISEEDKAHIFTPFFKTKDIQSKSLNANSHGLGLNICQQIARGLNGEITFKSVRGAGS